MSALLAQLVGSVQELSAQLHSKDAQIVVLAKQNQELGHRVAALEVVAAQQCLPSKTRSWVTALRPRGTASSTYHQRWSGKA